MEGSQGSTVTRESTLADDMSMQANWMVARASSHCHRVHQGSGLGAQVT